MKACTISNTIAKGLKFLLTYAHLDYNHHLLVSHQRVIIIKSHLVPKCYLISSIFHSCRWQKGTSLITPEEDVFYLVAFLSSARPSSTGKDGLDHILSQNTRILKFCEMSNLGIKQYLPHYSSQEEWKAHFGIHWEAFFRRKMTYDPLAILAPGQGIFRRAYSFDQQQPSKSSYS